MSRQVKDSNGVWHNVVGEDTNAVSQNTIAPVEVSPSISAHNVDTQIIYNGTLYKVISAIAVGDTLTVGINITASDALTEQIDSKQNTLTFDGTPTANSTNPVTSGGIKAAIDDAKTGIKEQIAFTLNDATAFYYSYIVRRNNVLIISGDVRGTFTANTNMKCFTITNNDAIIETPYNTSARFPTNNGYAWITANKEVYVQPKTNADNIQILLVIPLA